MKKPEDRKGKKVELQLVTEPGSDVFVAGTFNNWDPKVTPMRDNPDAGHYKAVLRLPLGQHEYKFVVNGEWHMDPNNPNWTLNNLGSLNSLITV